MTILKFTTYQQYHLFLINAIYQPDFIEGNVNIISYLIFNFTTTLLRPYNCQICVLFILYYLCVLLC